MIFHFEYDYFIQHSNELEILDFNHLILLPKHKLYSLFCSEKTKILREKSFSTIIYNVENLKCQASKIYKKKEFRKALKFYWEVRFDLISHILYYHGWNLKMNLLKRILLIENQICYH